MGRKKKICLECEEDTLSKGKGIFDCFGKNCPQVVPEPAPILQDYAPQEIQQAQKDIVRSYKSSLKGVARQTKKKKELKMKPSKLAPIEEGEGLSLKRKVGVYPPVVRNMLAKIGKEEITSLEIVRTPLSSFITGLLNVLSLGAFQKAVRESPYDKMFHLALFINGKYMTDKQSVITLTQSNPKKKSWIAGGGDASETMNVPLRRGRAPSSSPAIGDEKGKPLLTIQELLDNGKAFMGDEKFSNYDARTNNCQDYVLGLLRGSQLWTQELQNFIKQDAEVVFKKLPTISQKLAKFFTDVGAVADVAIEGQGVSQSMREEWIEIGGGIYPFPVKEGMTFRVVKALTGGAYRLYQNGEDCYTLMNIETGQVHGYCMTKENADKQLNLLQRIHNEEVARKIVKKDIEEKKPRKKNISKKEKSTTMETWRQFWSNACKGKKFGSRKEVNEYMREMAKKYKEMKSSSK